MSKTALRGGLVGCGIVANAAHMRAWRFVKGTEIVSLCDKDGVVAEQTARRWGVRAAYDDFSKMLQNEKLDFVDICTPPTTHHQLSIQAMGAGLHVLVEKPMSCSLSEADEMVDASRKQGVKLCVSHNFLFTPAVQTARKMVAEGAVGDLISVDGHDLLVASKVLDRKDHWIYSLPGEAFGEHSPHLLYLGAAFLGKFDSIRAIARKNSKFPWVKYDELKILVVAEKGMGAFTNSCNSSKFKFTLDIYGTDGSLHIDNVTQTIVYTHSRSNRTHALVLDKLGLSLQMLAGAMYVTKESLLGRKWYHIGQRALFKRFVESVRHNLEPPVTGENGRENVRVLQEVWRQID